MNSAKVVAAVAWLAVCALLVGIAPDTAGGDARPPAPAQAETTLPDTPAGRQLAALLAVFNTGDAAAMRKFVEENYAQSALAQRPVEQRAGVYADIFDQTRGVDVRRIVESEEHRIVVLVQERLAGDWRRMGLEVEPAAPHGILGLGTGPAPPPADALPSGPLDDAAVARELESYLEKLVAADRFSGAVLVTRDGRTAFRSAYGLASRSFQVPNRVDTKFNLGSMNKMFTAVAVAQLVEQGKLSFDDTVGQVWPACPNKEIAGKVTIHHLLTHTSGVGDYFNPRYFQAAKDRFRTVDDFLGLFLREPLHFEPGQDWRYSNGGFMLLGKIIEVVSGEDYFDYVRRHIYQPAGMANTDAYEMDRDTPNLAIGYTRSLPGRPPQRGELWNNLFLHVVKGGPAGGGFSTVEDLARFAAALRDGKLVSAKIVETLTTGKVETGPGGSDHLYAYGFMDTRVGGTRIVGHGGGFHGINGQLDIYLTGGWTVAVLSNYDPPAAERVARRLRPLLASR